MRSKAPSPQTERHSEGTQPRRGLRGWIRRGLVWMIAGILALALIGAVYQAVATEMDRRAYPPPGEMVDVGGHRLHIDCVGQGSPTVILESGLGTMSADWALVVEGAGHSTLQTDREDAQVTSAAIDQVVEAVRTDRPLAR